MLKVHLLIIDPQNDFCYPGFDIFAYHMGLGYESSTDLPDEILKQGSLYVPGAFEDMLRIGNMIERIGEKIYDIHTTLDTHHNLDIAHPSFWVSGSDGKTHPGPFTLITVDDVDNGIWRSKVPSWQKRAVQYVHSLQDNNRYALCIWPPHCMIGTFGHNVVQPLANILLNWEKKHGWINYVTKGSNMFTEHYSAVCADVPDPEDPTTDINRQLIEILEQADIIAIAGEAKSHCVANTIRDIANEFGEENVKKMVLLEDAMSNVPSFEKLGDDFINDMKNMGVSISNTNDFLA